MFFWGGVWVGVMARSCGLAGRFGSKLFLLRVNILLRDYSVLHTKEKGVTSVGLQGGRLRCIYLFCIKGGQTSVAAVCQGLIGVFWMVDVQGLLGDLVVVPLGCVVVEVTFGGFPGHKGEEKGGEVAWSWDGQVLASSGVVRVFSSVR